MPSHAPAPPASSVAQAIRRVACVVAWGPLFALVPGTAAAQALTTPPPAVTDSTTRPPRRGVSPRGAFLRAVVIPGWGHASIGAYNRGAFYVTLESATGWALVKARKRVQEAGQRVAFRERVVRDELAAQNIIDPDTVQARLDGDETLLDLRSLEESRRQQREDWTALGIFFLFLSGADAYVSAHLQHFPQPIELNAVPVGGGRMELSVSLKLPR